MAGATLSQNKMARKSIADSNSNLHYIPREILIQILARLTVKSLLRLRSVCQSWNSLITDPLFIQAHLKISSQNTKFILSYYESGLSRINRYSIRYDDESFSEYFEPQLPSHIPEESLRMHGSCNGLVCLSNEWTDIIYLWNPSLRKLKTLPNSPGVKSPIIYTDLDYHSICLAFGFHTEVNDYKVVKIWCLKYTMDEPYKYQFLTEVYSLSTDSWRRIDVALSCYLFYPNPAIVNGAAYWVAMKKTWEGSCEEYLLLVRFEMGDEVFEEVMLPDGVSINCYPEVAILGESLYLFIFDRLDKCCEIWTMECGKTSCWTKRCTANFRDKPAKVLALSKRGELLRQNHEGHLMSCHIETQTSKDLGIHMCLNHIASYVESFIQPDGGNNLFSLDNGNQPCELASGRKRKKK